MNRTRRHQHPANINTDPCPRCNPCPYCDDLNWRDDLDRCEICHSTGTLPIRDGEPPGARELLTAERRRVTAHLRTTTTR